MNQPQVKKSKSVIKDVELKECTFFVQISANKHLATLSFDGQQGSHSFWMTATELDQVRLAIEAAQKEWVENNVAN
jgi:hypothetical protein